MTLTQTTTHQAEAKARLVQQFKDSTDFRFLLDAYVEQIQDLEDVFFQLLEDRVIDTAVGEQLDGLGEIVGEERKGKSDAEYRLWIRGRIKANQSSGTPEEMLEIADLITDANSMEIEEYYPAGFNLIIYGDLIEDLDSVAAILDSASPAGVRAHVEYRLSAEALIFAFASGDSIVDLSFTERANPKNLRLNGIAHDGSGLWCAVGHDDTDSYIITSPNGIAWTERAPTIARLLILYDVAYDGSGLWCAVGEKDGSKSYILTSPDAITWTERTPTVQKNVDLRSIAHNGSGLWCAVGFADGTDSYILTSPDGITWTERAPTVSKNVNLMSVAHDGSGLWCACGFPDGADAYLISSPDGIVWTERANPKHLALYGIAHDGSGLWCAVGDIDGDAYIVTSPNGSVWTERTNPKNFELSSVAHDGVGLWFACGAPDGVDAYVLSSQNGINWFEKTNPKNFQLFSVAHDSTSLWAFVGAPDGVDAYLTTAPNPPLNGFSDDGGLSGGKWADAEEI